jgi:hypothetical protein
MFVGCGRSGTTLFRNIFDSHPDLAVTHEAHFVGPMAKRMSKYRAGNGIDLNRFLDDLYRDSNFRRQGISRVELRPAMEAVALADFADAVRAVFAQYAALNGKTMYGDKTPGSISYIAKIGSIFPETKFVHIVRDGRAVSLSYLERPEWGPKTMAEAAIHWKSRVSRGRRGGVEVGPSRYYEVKYEDMVTDPEKTTKEVCAFLNLRFDPAMLRYYEGADSFIASTRDPDAFKNLTRPVTGDLRNWRDEISDSDLHLFESIAGDTLRDLNYETSDFVDPASVRLVRILTPIAWQGKRARSYISRMAARRRSTGSHRS